MKKYTVCVLASLMLALLAVAGINYLVDPFFHYHKPYFGMSAVIDNELYQNPGIATYFDYDSFIIGSSMTENFRASEFDESFNCNTVKLPFSAIRTGSHNSIFTKAFNTHDVKNVFMGLDIDPLLDTYGNYYFPIPEYIYDNNPFNDVKYLLNKSVLFENTYNTVDLNLKNEVPDIDDAYMWDADFSKENALTSVYWEMDKQMNQGEHSEYLENTKENLEKNILPHIKNNPDTEFYVFYPPYSLLWWNLKLTGGELDAILDVLTYTSKELLEYDNVKVYFFQDIEEVITNLDNYKDYNHYNSEINSDIVAWMKEDKHLLDRKTFEKRISDFGNYVKEFDYSDWIQDKKLIGSETLQ